MNAKRARPFDRPADHLLLLLRESGPDAYRCHPQPGRWTARCPLCGEYDVDVREHGFGGRVSVRCGHGCDSDALLRRLTHPERCHACGSVYGQAAELDRAASAALKLAHEQQLLLRSLVDPEPGEMAA